MHILAHTYITQKFDTKTCRTVYKNTGGVPTKKEILFRYFKERNVTSRCYDTIFWEIFP